MADVLELKAAVRDRVGKGAARAIRRDGRVPGVIYGDKKSPESITLDYLELWMQHQTGSFLSTVYDIDIDGSKSQVIPKDVQLDPVRDSILHVDFLRLAKGATVTVEVSVHFINEEECPGVKRGGSVNVVRHTVEVTCPATSIPEEFLVDLTGLDIGDSVHISDVKLPDNVTPTITDRDFTIATIAGAIAEEVPEEDEVEGEGEGEGEEGAAEGEVKDEADGDKDEKADD
ncbi:MAG: 50S ribosomal protein L25/general stress protein Ctc [Hyphomicrobiaceae bacterium]